MCTARLFSQGSTSLHSNFTWTASYSINHSWYEKTRDTGLAYGEYRIPLHSLVLTQYQSVTDGRTDRRICRSIMQALAKLALRRAVITLASCCVLPTFLLCSCDLNFISFFICLLVDKLTDRQPMRTLIASESAQ